MGIAIKVENLSKAYQLGEIGTGTLSRDLERYWAKLRGKEDPFLKIGETNDRTQKGTSDMVWSLKDLNFEIEQGDAVGIIGRNGAGKSTLLKILSRVTSPTTGSIKIKGRVASLLEVGTGFHPELTGRENIFLNGAILGMRKSEIKKHFDAIVDFAGIERYIDTPVKRYSSGMYVRLAFAVAAHLESEILVVDEVLAVGDAEFQKKCLGKMNDVSKGEGRTVLFVSHNMASIQSLCSKSVILKNGIQFTNIDLTDNIINKYLHDLNKETKKLSLEERKDREGSNTFKFIEVIVNNNSAIISGNKTFFTFKIKNNCKKNDIPLYLSFSITKLGGNLISVISNEYIGQVILSSEGTFKSTFIIPKIPIMEGNYVCNIMLRTANEIVDWIKEAFIFEVENGDYYKTGKIIPSSHQSIFFDFKIEK
jgi:lipopolysaccharide transport system ATP-binding protein